MTQSAPALPIGNPTIVLFDIVGSTQHLLALGSTAYTDQQQRPFFDLCERLRQEHEGEQYGSHQGDALLYVFASPERAVAFADGLMTTLRDHPLEAKEATTGHTHRVKIRLAAHKAVQEMKLNPRGDYGYHPDVVYTARLLKIALDDQILLSENLYAALDTHRFPCEPYPNRRIRNWEEGPRTVYERLWDGVTKGEPGSRFLPEWFRQRNRYIPRTGLENAIIQAFRTKTPDGSLYRLVTIHGYGGMGKTRLAIQCAAYLAALFGDAMHFVALGDLFEKDEETVTPRDAADDTLPALLADRIGRSCGLIGEQALLTNLPRTLPKGMRLLIVDNYESVNCDRSAELLLDLLEANPELYLLVTGRAAVQVDDMERQFYIESMTPDEARRLFMGRAEQKRDFTAIPLTDTDQRAIDRILEYTVRIPLALELAAARAGQRSLPEIANGLEQAPLGAETETPERHRRADRTERHRSLTASLNWSFSLLSPQAQHALACIGLFADSFNAETLSNACNLPHAQAALDELLEASLIKRYEDENSRSRYTLLRPTRAYAADRLNTLPDTPDLRARYLSHYLNLVVANDDINNLNKLAVLESEWLNALAAADYADQAGYAEALDFLSYSLGGFLLFRGRWSEREKLNIRALQVSRIAGNRPAEGRTLNNLGIVYRAQGKWAEAIACYEKSLLIWKEYQYRVGEAQTLNNLGIIYQAQGQWLRAISCFKQSLITKREYGDRVGEGRTLNNLGGVYQAQGQWSEAIACYEQSLIIKRAYQDRAEEGQTRNNLGISYQAQGECMKALDCFEQSLIVCREYGDRVGEAATLTNLGAAYQSQGKWSEALTYYEQSLVIFREYGDRLNEGKTLENVALLYEEQDDIGKALEWERQALQVLETTQDARAIAKAQGLIAKWEQTPS